MFDFDAAMQIALSPVVTIPVIGLLVGTLVGTIVAANYRLKQRLRAQAARLGRAAGELLAMAVTQERKYAERRVDRAIEFAYDTLKDIGWEKLAKGNVTIDDFLSSSPFKDRDPFLHPSMAELHEALRTKDAPKDEKSFPGEGFGRPNRKASPGEGSDGSGGPKDTGLHHKSEVDYGFHSPRAG